MRYAFMQRHAAQFAIQTMSRVLAVSTSGYYAWCKRQPSQRARENARLLEIIRQVHQASRATYGSPRVHAELQARGIVVNRKRIARLMQHAGIQAKRKQRYKVTTKRTAAHRVAPNVLQRDFHADEINRKWVADITYIATREGWLYLATVLDTCSRKIVGWSMSPRLHTQLVLDALNLAVGQRDVSDALIHHSDQGSQYTADAFQQALKSNRIVISMSAAGNCYDNAMMESFFATLKTECVTEPYSSRRQARQAIFEFIEVWYNRQRRHSALGYLSPEQFECQQVAQHA